MIAGMIARIASIIIGTLESAKGKTTTLVTLFFATVAVTALIIGIISLGEVTTNRRASAHDSCVLLRGLVLAATNGNPTGKQAAQHFMATTPLHNCKAYAQSIVK